MMPSSPKLHSRANCRGEAASSGSGTIAGTVYVVGLSGAVMDEIGDGTWVRSEFYAGGH